MLIVLLFKFTFQQYWSPLNKFIYFKAPLALFQNTVTPNAYPSLDECWQREPNFFPIQRVLLTPDKSLSVLLWSRHFPHRSVNSLSCDRINSPERWWRWRRQASAMQLTTAATTARQPRTIYHVTEAVLAPCTSAVDSDHPGNSTKPRSKCSHQVSELSSITQLVTPVYKYF